MTKNEELLDTPPTEAALDVSDLIERLRARVAGMDHIASQKDDPLGALVIDIREAADTLQRFERDLLGDRVQSDAVREALEPVWHWYQSDEHPERPLAAIVADVVADLQQDRAWVLHPPKHRFWMPGEADCPREIKASNGELHTLRCKVCGQDSPKDAFCRARLATPPAPVERLWLWRNGPHEYWAFDNPFPTQDGGDPLTLGEPIGWAIFKPSMNGRPDYPTAQVEADIARATASPVERDLLANRGIVEAIRREFALTEVANIEASEEWLAGFHHAVARFEATLRAGDVNVKALDRGDVVHGVGDE